MTLFTPSRSFGRFFRTAAPTTAGFPVFSYTGDAGIVSDIDGYNSTQYVGLSRAAFAPLVAGQTISLSGDANIANGNYEIVAKASGRHPISGDIPAEYLIVLPRHAVVDVDVDPQIASDITINSTGNVAAGDAVVEFDRPVEVSTWAMCYASPDDTDTTEPTYFRIEVAEVEVYRRLVIPTGSSSDHARGIAYDGAVLTLGLEPHDRVKFILEDTGTSAPMISVFAKAAYIHELS